MVKWLHHLLNPHCVECSHEAECKSCDTLQGQLAIANETIRQLTLTIVDLSKPVVVSEYAPPTVVTPEALAKKRMPWKVKQALLEQEDRVKAATLRDAPKPEESITISSLEDELAAVEKARTENAQVN